MNKYFDICATTPIDKDVSKLIHKYNQTIFGNPSSIHEFGQKSKALIERSRLDIAKSINCSMGEIVFTCNGTMSNNMALLGTLEKGDHFITSSYEHPAILKVSDYLLSKGIEVTLIKPDEFGIIIPGDIEDNIKDNTKLISIMYVNNEIGTINPLVDISNIAQKYNILFHTDAVQAMGKIKVDVKEMGVDLMSLSGHKFYAPKGVGILFIKEETLIKPILFGGGQELNLFPGTENIINIRAMAEAAKICCKQLDEKYHKMKDLENYFITLLNNNNIDYMINGKNRVPGILNITLQNTNSPSFIINLDKEGYAISSGSACASGSLTGSHTLNEIGLNENTIKKSYRISFGRFHTKEDIKNLSDSISYYIHKGSSI